jgi:ribosomal protein S18 acetylase RimI-like enzyme
MTLVTTRRATPTDAETVQLLLLELADHESSGQHVRVDVRRWRELLAEDDVVVLLAEEDGHPVGYVSAVRQLSLWQGRHLLALDDLYVRAPQRGRRVGEALMRAVAEYAGSDRLLVRWELNADNDGARRFYLRLGATVRDKGIATWQPHDYTALLGETPGGGPAGGQ